MFAFRAQSVSFLCTVTGRPTNISYVVTDVTTMVNSDFASASLQSFSSIIRQKKDKFTSTWFVL
jgi:hypothetical protein